MTKAEVMAKLRSLRRDDRRAYRRVVVEAAILLQTRLRATGDETTVEFTREIYAR